MNTYLWLIMVWGLVTIALVSLLVYRSRLEKQESDWIPLTDDEREDRAIRAQTMIEMKTQRLTLPIRALGTLSVALLLAIVGFWLYQGITTPPPPPQ
jgi:hypothetical protein